MKNSIFFQFILISSVFSFAFLFVGCSSENQSKENLATIAVDTAKAVESKEPLKVRLNVSMSISDVPFPFEILENMYDKKVVYDDKAMNDLSNISKYVQYNSKALNLGIYGADLSYAVTYEQFQKIGPYVKNTKKIAEDLNIGFAFNQEMMDRYNKFKDNKDSLTEVVFECYQKVDKALKNDQRVGIASLVVTGSWIEGLYLSTKIFITTPKTEDNKTLYKIIGNQKQSLLLVIKLLEENKKDAFIASVIISLEEITSDYNEVTDDKILNEIQLLSIHKKVDRLRNKMINGL